MVYPLISGVIQMNKLYNVLIGVGFVIMVFFTFQWWQGTQSVKHVSEDQLHSDGSEDVKEKPTTSIGYAAESEEREDIAIPDTPPMTNDLNSQFDVGEAMASLYIPSLESKYETYWGADDATLKRGVGMYVSEWTTTPDEKGHTVLSGHRDTVFSELGELETGEQMFLEYEDRRYEYEIEKIWITDADDLTVIVRKDIATLTLTTCYPFQYIGAAPDRYIIQAVLIDIQDM